MNQFIFKKWGLKLTLALGVLLYSQMASAVDKYWVGPNGGGFNSGANWANTSGGAGGAGSPGTNDRAVFDQGSNNCDINVDISVQGINITSGYSGTITQTTNKTVTIGSGHFTQAGGTFTGGTGFIDINGFFTQSSGTFTSTSGTMTWGNDVTISGGTFNHNSGTVTFDDINGRNVDINSSITFNNLTLSKTNNNDTISIAAGDTLVVNATLTMGNGKFSGGSALEARGDIIVQSAFDGGSTPLQIKGNAAQNFTLTGATGLFDADITVNKSGNQVTLTSALVMDANNQDLTIVAGTLDISGQNLTVNGSGGVFSNDGTIRAQGGETFTGSFDTNSGTAVYNGSGSYTSLPFGNFYNHLTFNGAGSWRHAGTLDVNGDLNIAAGTLNSNSQNINLAGNWTNSSTYTPGTNTVTLDGSSQAINGSTSFSSLSKSVLSNATLTFQAGSTTTVTGTLTLQGSPSSVLNLRSSTTSQANIDPQGSRNIQYVDVSYSNNINSIILNCFTGCTDSLNNTNWLFGQPSVSWTSSAQSSVGESGTMIVTAQLSSAEGADVTVPYNVGGTALSGGTDYTIPTSPLIIPAGATSASITITIVGDLIDENNETVVITMTSPINASLGATDVHTATITDDDSAPTVTLGATSSSIGENGGVSVLTATLSGVSGLNVTVNLVYSGTGIVNTDYTRTAASISINAGATTGTVTLTGVNDSLYEGTETIITDISTVVNGTESGVQQATVNIIDDDTAPTVSLSATSSSIAENGGTSTITATLSAVSGLNTTVNVTYSGTATPTSDYTRSASSLSILAGSTTGTITLTGVNDSIDDNAETIITTLGSLVNASSGTPNSVTVTITDDDTAGVTINQSGGSTNLTEGGATDTFTAVLTSQPTANVAISISHNAQVTVDQSTLTFTTANWNTPQTVTVSAEDDDIAEGNHTGLVSFAVVSIDSSYNAMSLTSVTVNLTDNDTASVSVTETSGSTSVTEGGSTDTYNVVLTSQPTSSVTVTVVANSQVTTNITTLTFIGANWDIPQTVTVSAVDDSVAEGTHTGSITHTSASSDSNYNGLTITSITASITDNDSSGVSIAQSGGTTSLTPSRDDTYTVVLTSQPTATVTVTVNATSLVDATPLTLTFTTSNWDEAQVVVLSMTGDFDGTESSTITHTSSSIDSSYNAISIASVVVALGEDEEGESTGSGTGGEEETTVTANAGVNRTVIAGQSLTLDGSGSEGTNLTYHWAITSGSGSLSDSGTVNPTFTTTLDDDSGTTTVRLTVSDENQNSDFDEVTISIINQTAVSQTAQSSVIIAKSSPSNLVFEESSTSNRIQIIAGSATIVLPESASEAGDYNGYNVLITDEGYMVIAVPGDENSKGKVFFSQTPVDELGNTIDLDTDISASYTITDDELGNPDMILTDINPDTQTSGMTSITGAQGDTNLGAYLSYGDINNDGSKEILISAPGAGHYGVVYIYDQTGTLVGVIFGSEEKPIQSIMSSSYIAEALDDVFFGPNNQALNEDLHYEEPVTSENTTNFTFFLAGSDTFEESIDFATTDSDASIETSEEFQSAAFGDINGDDEEDLILAGLDGTLYIFFGTLNSGSDINILSADVTVTGGTTNDNFGQMVLTADVTGDGINDILIGAPLYGDEDTGAIYVLFGREDWASTVNVTTDTSTLLISGSLANGQIGSDILVADPNEDGIYSIYSVTSSNTNIKIDVNGDTSESVGRNGVSVLGASCSLKTESTHSDMKPYVIQILFLGFAITISILLRKRRHP